MKRKELVFAFLVLLFIGSFFFSFAASFKVILLGVLVVYSLFDDSLREKLFIFKKRPYLWFMLAFTLMLLTSFLVSDNRADGLRFLQLRIPLILFPLSVGLLRFSKKLRDKILLGIAILVTVACLVSLIWAFFQYAKENNSGLLYNDSLSLLIGQQSIYTSLFVNISIYIFVYNILYNHFSTSYKLTLSLSTVFLFVISYLLASRNMMLILYITTLAFSLFFILKKKKYLQGLSILGGLLLAVFLVFNFFPKTINRFKELAFTQFSYQNQGAESHYAGVLRADQWNGANFRLAAWQCGWELFKEHPLTGVGLGDKRDELNKTYQQKGFQFAIDTKKNVHNNYLDVLLSMGLIGFILFIIGWILLPLVQVIRNRDALAFLIIATFTFAMITENYFDRSIGAMLFAFFIPFLLSGSAKPEPHLPV